MAQYPELAWIAEARKHIGLKEIPGKQHNPIILSWLDKLKAWWRDDETPWCGTFIAHCLQNSGITYPKKWMTALDYLNAGVKLSRPCYGCVAVKSRKGGGHVCFVVGKTETGRLVVIGGNQNNMVSYALYNESDFEGFMWYGMANKPADHRYELPILKGIQSTKVTEA